MNTSHNFKKMIVGALLSGGVALAGFGLTAGTAQAARTGQAQRSTTRTSVCPLSSASGAAATAFPADWTSTPASTRLASSPPPSNGSVSG